MLDWVIGTSVAVSALIILVLIIRRPFARMFGARAAYALWLLPFIRLAMPEVTIPRIFPQFTKTQIPTSAPALPSEIALTPEMIAALQAQPSLMSQIQPYILPALFALWVFGAVFFFLYHWVRQASLMDRLTYASEPALNIRHEIKTAARAANLKHLPQVRISDEKAGPLVAGFFSPVVILPENFMTVFSPEQRRYALLHEFMHIRRGDVWVALAWLVFRAVNWPNPLVHYAAKHFRSDQEAACDATVLSAMGDSQKAVAGYAETLIHAAKTAIITENHSGRASPLPSQLALTIHHPLKERLMILGTHRKTSNWRSRTAAAVMIIGAATLSAPLIQADAHPEEELAGKYSQHQGKSVIKRKYTEDGKTVSEHFEINVDGDDVKAYKIGPFGKKTRIDVEDIDGVDVPNIMEEKIEGDVSRRITISNGDNVKFLSEDNFKKWAKTEFPEWKEEDFDSWVKGDFDAWVSKMTDGKLAFLDKDGNHFDFKSFPRAPKPPLPPGLSKHSENVFVLDSDDFEGLKGLKKLEALRGLEGLKKLEALKHLKNLDGLEGLEGLDGLDGLDTLDGFETFTFFTDGEDRLKLKMRLTESKLAAARAMLEDTEVEADDSREMARAKRELEKARRALKAAERALKDAE